MKGYQTNKGDIDQHKQVAKIFKFGVFWYDDVWCITQDTRNTGIGQENYWLTQSQGLLTHVWPLSESYSYSILGQRILANLMFDLLSQPVRRWIVTCQIHRKHRMLVTSRVSKSYLRCQPLQDSMCTYKVPCVSIHPYIYVYITYITYNIYI